MLLARSGACAHGPLRCADPRHLTRHYAPQLSRPRQLGPDPSGTAARHRRGAASQRAAGRRVVTTCALTLPALAPASSPWGIWAALTFASAVGLWSEKTRLGKKLSGPLVSTLVGLALSNLGVIPAESAVYGTVNSYLLPLAVPLLLLTADLRRVVQDTGRLLGAFLLGSAATVAGTLAAWKLLPLHSLGAEGWKVGAALAARHIGGAVNYVGVCETLAVSPSAQMAGLAADNLICALYFTTLFALARGIPPDAATATDPGGEGGAAAAAGAAGAAGGDAPRPPADADSGGGEGKSIGVLEGATALALSAAVCYVGNAYARSIGYGTIPIVTAITVALATAAPRVVAPLAPSGEGIAAILMQIFFATVGANGSIAAVLRTAPVLFVFSALQIFIHLALLLAAGHVLGFSRRDLLLASNANVGGPTTAAGMAATKGWKNSLVPALLVGVFGYAVATFVAVALGRHVLAVM